MIENGANSTDVIVVGAGPAGLGVSVVLEKLGIDYIILDRQNVGSSFESWPKESRFISPSFTGNFFNIPDLNSVTPETSPAFNLLTEHPSGIQYASYLKGVCNHYKLKVQKYTNVRAVKKQTNQFILDTNLGPYTCKYLIWAAGEYQYPANNSFSGSHLCTHFSKVKSFASLEGEKRIVIGGYESGFDAAIHLTRAGKNVELLDRSNNLVIINSDSSYSLSPYTRDRINKISDNFTYHPEATVVKVEFLEDSFVVTTTDKREFRSKHKPINCTGFDTSLSLINNFFEFNEKYPVLNRFDESSRTENLFLVGPQVKHGQALFCFVYKYRQRFGIVGEEIAKRMNKPIEIVNTVLQNYRDKNFLLRDLSCCDDECIC